MNRDQFLQSLWQSYPLLPGKTKAYGAIQHILHENSLITLKVNDHTFQLELKNQKTKDLEFCVVNDLVAIDEENQVTLLAPCLAKPFMNSDLKIQNRWNEFLKNTRQFFEQRHFLEVQTPSLVVCPGPEPTLEVFATEWIWGSQRKKLFLPTSPELSIKKYLAHAVRQQPDLKVFEIAKVFRNSEITERHHPEFFMLEWYRCFQDLESTARDILDLVKFLSGSSQGIVEKKSMAQLFLEILDFQLTPQTTAQELKSLAKKMGVETRQIENFDDLFHLIFLEKIEFQWPKDHLFFLEKYPPSQAALARVDSDGWAERFEFYWQGFEIANAFHELNDPILQRQRMIQDLELKKTYNRQAIAGDKDFLQALEYGLPPTSGVALGLERLFMALENKSDISELKFPLHTFDVK